MKERAIRPWRKAMAKKKTLPSMGLSGRLRPEADLHQAMLAARTGNWGAYQERKRWHRRMAETELMAFEDAYCRCAWRAQQAIRQRRDYEVYVKLVARYGVPFSEAEFAELGPRAGETFAGLVHRGAVAWQNMWWYYAPVYRLRRTRGATNIGKTFRGYATRKRWVPILHLRTTCGKHRPMRMALGHWHRVILRTVRARQLVKSIKNHKMKTLVREWRQLVGDEASNEAVDRVFEDLFADELFHPYELFSEAFIDEYEASAVQRLDNYATKAVQGALANVVDPAVELVIAEFCRKPPAFMDANWYLQKTSYQSHVLLAEAGVLPKSLFEDSHRNMHYSKNATTIQRLARGVQGRDRVREKVARTFRKRYDGTKFYYVNLRTTEKLADRPLLIPKLWPRSVY
mmetsp:Transcript_24955/g.74897  ORF Transcript_24955/g.74897 Transcript_24955/m.74897 type:complete len:401 (-) Transcript_24955:28-1230(-)